MSKQILVFGDSIAYGAWDEEGGWVDRLKVFTNKKAIESNLEYYCAVYNLAIDGDTTDDLLKRMDVEIRQRVTKEKMTIIFAIGSNDSEVIGLNNSFNTDPKTFENNIREIISRSKKYSSKIIFLGLLPVDESRVDPIPWARKRSYKNESIKTYNNIISSVCEENKIDFIEMYNRFYETDYNRLLIDGVHPDSKGHEKIYGIVEKYLEERKII